MALKHLPEQVGLVFEVVVDQAGRPDAGGLGDILVGGVLEALLRKDNQVRRR